MKSILLSLLAAGSASIGIPLAGAAAPSDRDELPPFVVAGYLPDYRYGINVNAPATHLTDLMLFSLTPEAVLEYADTASNGGGSSSCCLSTEHYEKIRKARAYKNAHHPPEAHGDKLRLLLTVGGGGRSEGFQDIVAGDAQVRQKFLKALVHLCHAEELDGIDFDFEGIASHPTWKSYLNFLGTASAYLHQHGLLITVALHPGNLVPPEVCNALDRIHIMTYDMLQKKPDDKQPKHHASFDSTKAAIGKFSLGCPRRKLVMGIPAYGRHEDDSSNVKTYSEVVDAYMETTHNHNDNAKILESIQSLDSWDGYHFDSPNDIKTKVKFAKEHGYGGVFLWELGQDKQMAGMGDGSGGILLEAAASYDEYVWKGKSTKWAQKEEL